MSISSDSVENWLERVRAGDERAAAEIWEQFFPQLVALAADQLNHVRGTTRDNRASNIRTRPGRYVSTVTWVVGADPKQVGDSITYRITRSEEVPFDFAEVFLSVPGKVELIASVVEFGVLSTTTTPELAEVKAAAEHTIIDLVDRDIVLWQDVEGNSLKIARFSAYGYQRSTRKFVVTVEDRRGSLRHFQFDELSEANRIWLVSRCGKFWRKHDGAAIGPAIPVDWQSPVVTLVDAELSPIRLTRFEATEAGGSDHKMLSESEWNTLRSDLERSVDDTARPRSEER